MGSVVSLGDKIAELLRPLHQDLNWFRGKLVKAGAALNTTNAWLETGETRIRIQQSNRDLIVEVLASVGVRFDAVWFDITFDAFQLTISRRDEQIGDALEGILSDGAASNPARNSLLQAVTGTYQLIRPYVDAPEKFVLEPLQISPGGALTMYSHNKPLAGYHYSGLLHIDLRYAFARIKRTHEQSKDRVAMRCLTIYLENEGNGDALQPRHCFSGFMLRGRRWGRNGKMAVSLPFVAIRANADSDLASLGLGEPTDGVFRLADGVLLGLAIKDDPTTGAVFTYCQRVFQALNGRMALPYGMQTLHPTEVAEILTERKASKDDEPLRAWLNVVEGSNLRATRGEATGPLPHTSG